MKNRISAAVAVAAIFACLACGGFANRATESSQEAAQSLLAGIDLNGAPQRFHILEPAEGAVYPSDLAAPLFAWQGPSAGVWLVRVTTPCSREPLYFKALSNPWVPSRPDWECIKALAPGEPLKITFFHIHGRRLEGKGEVGFRVSRDPFAARVVYQEIPVPFRFAEKNVDRFRWRSFAAQAYEPPAILMTGLPYCANCHAFSGNAKVFGLDIDYRGDRGGYLLADVAGDLALRRAHLVSWNDYRRGEDGISRGLFAKISPDGEHVLATVKERPFLVRIDDPAYSQLFFPLTGHLVFYSRSQGTIQALPGADDPDVVQTSPAWSPDGRIVAFARANPSQDLWKTLGSKNVLDAGSGEDIHVLNQRHQVQFDIWQVPFNQGNGGVARPLPGASANGKSNYFPRYTPDGRWIVFCQSDTGMVSQPGSRLMIAPADGSGDARAMACNRPELNSWHSFAPNGRWMVFSSKPHDGLLTRIYLTHLDDQGQDTPPVLLHRIGSPGFAAAIPEAVDLPQWALERIRLIEP